MARAIEEMIDLVWLPPRGVKRQYRDRKHPDNFQYYHQWGFTIYRTYYGPSSDQYWHMLLGALKQQTQLALGYYEDNDTGRGDVQRLNELFFLDAREDASVLDGLDVRGVQVLYQSEASDDKRAMADEYFRFILLADESVFKNIAGGEFIIKAVALDWVEGFPGWGWMRIPTGYLLELWQLLVIWRYDTEGALRFDGSEKDLEDYV